MPDSELINSVVLAPLALLNCVPSMNAFRWPPTPPVALETVGCPRSADGRTRPRTLTALDPARPVTTLPEVLPCELKKVGVPVSLMANSPFPVAGGPPPGVTDELLPTL